MSDQMLINLTAITSPAAADVLYVVADPATDPKDRKVTLANLQTSILTDCLVTTAITIPNTGLHILDTNASHDLIVSPGSNLTADRTLTLTTGDADRTLTLSANLTVEAASLVNQDLTTDATPQFSGLGLNTAAPVAKFAVEQAAYAASAVDYNDGIALQYSGSPTWSVEADASHVYMQSWSRTLQLNNQGNNIALCTTAGNVGIRTASPGAALHIYHTGAASTSGGILVGEGITANQIALLITEDTTAGAGVAKLSQQKSGVGYGDIALQPDGGRVGIGTASPTSILSIVGSTATEAVPPPINLGLRATYSSGASQHGIGFYVNSSTFMNSGIMAPLNALAFYVGTDWSSADATEKVRITSTGVGIGTTTPAYMLTINSATGVAADGRTYTSTSAGASGGFIDSYQETTGGYGYQRYMDIVACQDSDGANGGGVIRFLTNPISSDTAVERMRITKVGYVGIGTPTPEAGVHVYHSGAVSTPGTILLGQGQDNGESSFRIQFDTTAGNGRAHLYSIKEGTGYGDVLLCPAGGYVGIGTAVPAGLLDVRDGSVYLTDADVSQPATTLAAAAAYARFSVLDPTAGGLDLKGLSDSSAPGLKITGVVGTAGAIASTAVYISGVKSDGGTGVVAIGASEAVLQVYNASTPLVSIYGGGDMSVGGNFSVGQAPNIAISALIAGSNTSAANEYGAYVNCVFSDAVSVDATSYHSNPSTAAVAFTCPDLFHYSMTNATKGAGSAITRQYGYYVPALTSGATNYGLCIADQSTGASNYAIYVAGGKSVFMGNVGMNELSPDYQLDVNGAIGFTPGASVTPVDNGDVVFELTNNTTLTVKAKGSDGTVRSGTISLT